MLRKDEARGKRERQEDESMPDIVLLDYDPVRPTADALLCRLMM